MRHDWIFDVLTDLRSYALKNGLPDLAAQVEISLKVARDEVAAANRNPEGDEDTAAAQVPTKGRPH